MDKAKHCPIIVASGVIAQGATFGRAQFADGWCDCSGPACAWWDARAERCALLTLARKA